MDTLKYCDFNIICRICLSKSGKTYFTDAAILNIIHKLTDLDFRTDDLPQQICQKCLDKINDICEFSFHCIRSHSALIECFNQQKNRERKKATVDVLSYNITEYENHINEDEVEEETTQCKIFDGLDRIKTKELKEEILDLKPDVIYLKCENQINEDEVTTRTSEINESLDNLETEEPQEHNVKEVTTNNKISESEIKISINNSDGSYKCENSRLVQHNRVHRDQGRFKCGQCSKTFTRLWNLEVHKRIHSGERPYKCGQCLKTFAHQSNLVDHKRTHSGERPYKCDQCTKAFSRSSQLVRHVRQHHGECLYKCSQCSKTFTRPWNLVRHERIHSYECPYKSKQCLKTSNQPLNLYHKRVNKHKKTSKNNL